MTTDQINRIDLEALNQDPLFTLLKARRMGDDVTILSHQKILSRRDDVKMSVAVFGNSNNRTVLSDIHKFRMPVPVAKTYSFPDKVAQLNHGLFSMVGKEHRVHQQLLVNSFQNISMQLTLDRIKALVRQELKQLEQEGSIKVLHTFRGLSRKIATVLLFGEINRETQMTGELIQSFFLLRRKLINSRECHHTKEEWNQLFEIGEHLSDMLRLLIQKKKHRHATERFGLLNELIESIQNNATFKVEHLMAHTNVMFMSATEPIAVTMTWLCLILSQKPSLQRELTDSTSNLTFRHVVFESLRLFPPSSIIVRVTSEDVELPQIYLPRGSEVWVLPFVTHREEHKYEQADLFLPHRWNDFIPKPYDFIPFGGGQRYCVGKPIAIEILSFILQEMQSKFNLCLCHSTRLDWVNNVNLMPSSDFDLKLTAKHYSMSLSQIDWPNKKNNESLI